MMTLDDYEYLKEHLTLADALDELGLPDEAARRRDGARAMFEQLRDSAGLEQIKGALRAR